MGLDIFALLLSGIAIAISVLSYRASREIKRRDWRIEAGRIGAETGLNLAAINRSANTAKHEWAASLAARGMYESGTRISIENEIDQKVGAAESLKVHLSEVLFDLDKVSDSELENRIIRLTGIAKQASDLTEWFTENEIKRRGNRQDLRK